jgi:hypothetical protein
MLASVIVCEGVGHCFQKESVPQAYWNGGTVPFLAVLFENFLLLEVLELAPFELCGLFPIMLIGVSF